MNKTMFHIGGGEYSYVVFTKTKEYVFMQFFDEHLNCQKTLRIPEYNVRNIANELLKLSE